MLKFVIMAAKPVHLIAEVGRIHEKIRIHIVLFEQRTNQPNDDRENS